MATLLTAPMVLQARLHGILVSMLEAECDRTIGNTMCVAMTILSCVVFVPKFLAS